MKAFVIGALSLSTLVGCSDGHPAVTSCSALAACCSSGLPGGAGLSCTQLSGSTDQASCDAALSSLHNAGYCKDVSSGPTVSGSDSCPRYLSCLLATEPEAYAAAIQLYGQGSACWTTAAQTAGCEQACEAAYAKIDGLCSCVGTTCSKCDLPTSGSYRAQASSVSTCGDDIHIYDASLGTNGDNQGTLTLYYDAPQGSGQVMLKGALQCSGTSMLTGTTMDELGCKADVSATLTQPAVGDFLTLSGTWKITCPSYPTETCSQTFSLSR